MKLIFSLFLLMIVTGLASAQDIDVLHYEFEIALHDNNDSIEGKTSVQVVIKKPGAAVFDLTGVADGKGMKVTVATLFYKTLSPVQFTQTAQQLSIPTTTNKAGDTAWITIYYKGIPDDGLIISKNRHGDRTFFADNWPNRAHHWLPCVDRPDDKATFEFMVTAPSGYSVISNGFKMEEKSLNAGRKLTHWKELTPLPTKVMVIGVAKFAVRTYADSPEGVPISAWVYPQDSTKGFYDYGLAPGIIKFFSGYIAPFPYSKLANVQSKTIFGGMENASAIFYAESSVTGDRSSEDLMAHEIAHQWFGDMASEKSFAHLWLSEGFATYFTNLYFEKKYGAVAMSNRLKQEREEAIAFSKKTTHAVVDSSTNLMSLLNANSYQKAGWVLHMLRGEVGEIMFQRIIQAYYNQYKGGNAETRDFEAVAEKVWGKDLRWFFDQWLYRPGVPQLSFQLVTKKKKKFLQVMHLKDVYQFWLDVQPVILKGAAMPARTIRITNKATLVPLPDGCNHVEIDPNTRLLFDGPAVVK